MGGSCSTSDSNSHFHLRPLHVAISKSGIYDEAKTMASDLPGWELIRADDARLTLTCTRRRGVLAGSSTITITIEGPEGIPSSTVNVQSVTTGAWPGCARDRANVLEFMTPFHRRVC